MTALLAVTMGEPAGIGGEILLKAWLRGVPPFVALDDPDRLADLARRLDLAVPVLTVASAEEARARFDDALPVLPVRLNRPAAPGVPEPVNSGAVVASIERAVAMVTKGEAAAVVTNPISKATLYRAGFHFPGHTEYLAYLAGGHHRPVMMLATQDLRVVPVTIHIPLSAVAERLKREDIVACGRITADALRQRLGIPEPRLGVAALNPHGGEDGTLGREEIDIIAPAVAELAAAGIRAEGPLPADTLFHEGARRRFDAVLCMYHDQALIPIKTLDFAGGVNVTLGLPFVRTSPDHGTAFDIAGTGRADESSLCAAMHLAADMAPDPA